MRRTVFAPFRELVGGGCVRAGQQRAHLLEAGVDEMSGIVDPPLTGESATAREHGPPHEPRGPDVAEHPALVADRVGQTSLVEQLVERGPMLLGHLAARRRSGLRRPTSTTPPRNGGTNGAAQRVRQLEREGVRDVEAVEEPVPDEVEIRGHGDPGPAIERAQRIEHATGIVLRLEQLLRARILPDRGDQLPELRGRPRRHGRRAAHQAEQLGRWEAGPVADVGEKVSVGTTAAAVKRMCW